MTLHSFLIMEKLLFIWNELKSTFWFVPIFIVLLGMGLAFLTISIDNQVDLDVGEPFEFFFPASADSARTLLSTVAGAMITVAGTVFSMTLVALTLASSQYGARLLRNFMHVRLNQVVLGTYVALFAYCLIVLNVVRDIDDIVFIPRISVLVAIIASLLNIILLVIFIHGMATSIQADKIISDITSKLEKQMKSLYPESMGTEREKGDKCADVDAIMNHYAECTNVVAEGDGYLQYIDNDFFERYADENDSLLIMDCVPGDYIVKGMDVIKIYSHQTIELDVLKKFHSGIILGKIRTPQQDIEFSIHQIVEVADKALSPGINDPFTAIACIDNITSILCQLSRVNFPSKFRFNENDRLIVVAKPLSFEGMVDASFHSIRQYSAGSPLVAIRVMESLVTIYEYANKTMDKIVLERHMKMMLRLADRSFPEKNDIDDMRKRVSHLALSQ